MSDANPLALILQDFRRSSQVLQVDTREQPMGHREGGPTPTSWSLFLFTLPAFTAAQIRIRAGADICGHALQQPASQDRRWRYRSSIDGCCRLIAGPSTCNSMHGQLGPFWCDSDGAWIRRMAGEGASPRAARVGVLRHGHFAELHYLRPPALYTSYVGKGRAEGAKLRASGSACRTCMLWRSGAEALALLQSVWAIQVIERAVHWRRDTDR